MNVKCQHHAIDDLKVIKYNPPLSEEKLISFLLLMLSPREIGSSLMGAQLVLEYPTLL